jgi:hypothetical protein
MYHRALRGQLMLDGATLAVMLRGCLSHSAPRDALLVYSDLVTGLNVPVDTACRALLLESVITLQRTSAGGTAAMPVDTLQRPWRGQMSDMALSLMIQRVLQEVWLQEAQTTACRPALRGAHTPLHHCAVCHRHAK